MTTQELTSRAMQLQALCDGVRKYAKARDYQKCVTMICKAMGEFPDAPWRWRTSKTRRKKRKQL